MKDFGPAIQNAAAACMRGDWAGAEKICRRVLAAKSNHFDALTLMGIVSAQTGRDAEAAAFFSRAVDTKPGEPSAHNNLGNAYKALGRYDEALASYDQAIKRQPDYAEAHYNRGLALQELERWEDALESYDFAISLKPDYAEAHTNRGIVLRELKRLNEALESYDRALSIQPDLAQTYSNRGIALKDLYRLDEALQNYDRAIALQPNYAEAYCNRANTLKALNRLDEALESYSSAFRIEPDYAEAHHYFSICCLLIGDFARGWTEHEWRWKSAKLRKELVADERRFARDWDGQALQGALLVLPEQGIGDEIFYSGMLNDLRSSAESITVCLDPRLIALYERSFKNMNFVTRSDLSPDRHFDAQIHLASLGRYFRGSAGALAQVRVPYLRADAGRVEALRARLNNGNRLICGLSWVSKNPDIGADKSLKLRDLEPVLRLPGVDFVDLQYGDTTAEQSALNTATGITLRQVAEIDNYNDIDGLAALIGACDVVVTVSNTTAHLAAALGKPVLVMLSASVGLLWYWHVDRDDSPWYPGVRLFRQQRINDWTAVIERVRLALLQSSSKRAD